MLQIHLTKECKEEKRRIFRRGQRHRTKTGRRSALLKELKQRRKAIDIKWQVIRGKNKIGEDDEAMQTNQNLSIINDGNTPRRKHNIDNTLTTSKATKIENWNVRNDIENLSDHCYIMYSIIRSLVKVFMQNRIGTDGKSKELDKYIKEIKKSHERLIPAVSETCDKVFLRKKTNSKRKPVY